MQEDLPLFVVSDGHLQDFRSLLGLSSLKASKKEVNQSHSVIPTPAYHPLPPFQYVPHWGKSWLVKSLAL
jgi:hypothetical protein